MENNKMRAILAEVGQEPRIYELSIDGDQQQEELCDLLGGNWKSSLAAGWPAISSNFPTGGMTARWRRSGSCNPSAMK